MLMALAFIYLFVLTIFGIPFLAFTTVGAMIHVRSVTKVVFITALFLLYILMVINLWEVVSIEKGYLVILKYIATFGLYFYIIYEAKPQQFMQAINDIKSLANKWFGNDLHSPRQAISMTDSEDEYVNLLQYIKDVGDEDTLDYLTVLAKNHVFDVEKICLLELQRLVTHVSNNKQQPSTIDISKEEFRQLKNTLLDHIATLTHNQWKQGNHDE